MKKTLYANFIVFLLWQALHMSLSSSIIPSPLSTLENFIIIFPKVIFPHLIVSLVRIVVAIFISLAIGISVGIWIGMNQMADELISPIVYILYPLPKVAFLPILMILFGLGNTPKIVLIVIIIVFQIILAVRDGVKEIPDALFMSVQSLDINRFQIYRHLIFPAILPKVFTTLRISIGISIAVLFFAETFATTYGIGYYIMNSWSMINYLDMFSGIFALGLVGIILFKIIDLWEHKVCGWLE